MHELIQIMERLTLQTNFAIENLKKSGTNLVSSMNEFNKQLNKMPIECIELFYQNDEDKEYLLSYFKEKELYNICQAITNLLNNINF